MSLKFYICENGSVIWVDFQDETELAFGVTPLSNGGGIDVDGQITKIQNTNLNCFSIPKDLQVNGYGQIILSDKEPTEQNPQDNYFLNATGQKIYLVPVEKINAIN